MSDPYNTRQGVRYPPGAKPDADGVNFSVFSRHATQVDLLLFEQADSAEPFQVVPLKAEVNRTFFAWHVYVDALPVGTWYAWRMDGPSDTWHSGLRFDKDKVLLDPWARVVSHTLWDRQAAEQAGGQCPLFHAWHGGR